MNLEPLQADLGLHFHNVNLLEQALTHRSYLNEQTDEGLQNNERLEFLGDAVLDFLIGNTLFHRYPAMPEGELTRLRAALVRTETLAQLALQCHFGDHVRMSRGEETTGGRTRQNILADTFEAVIGALYLDQGLPAVEAFVMPLFMPLTEYILAENLHRDARSMFQEWSQATRGITPFFRVVESAGPEHDKQFTVEAVLGKEVVAVGTGKSKQSAAQAAARAALKRIEQGDLTSPLAEPVKNQQSDV
jgi:ribonuclease III